MCDSLTYYPFILTDLYEDYWNHRFASSKHIIRNKKNKQITILLSFRSITIDIFNMKVIVVTRLLHMYSHRYLHYTDIDEETLRYIIIGHFIVREIMVYMHI